MSELKKNNRFLWVILVILSWYGSALLILAAWNAFVTNPISFGVETTYTDWDTKLPAVAICEANNKLMIYNVSDTLVKFISNYTEKSYEE